MNVTFDKTSDVTGKIIVNVEPADYTETVKKELKKIAATHVIPGFRKGHVPMDQLRRRFGKQVKSDVINDVVYREVFKYIQDNKLDILGQPLPLDVKELTDADEAYTFSYEVGLAPKLDLEINKDITFPYYTIEVSDEMRAEQDKMMRERLGSQQPGEEFEDKALVKGVMMELNADGTVNETENAIQVLNAIVGPTFFKNADETAKFQGCKVGDKVVFNPFNSCNGNEAELASMLNMDKAVAANVKSDFEFAVSEIIVLRPAEHTQEFFDQVFGADKVHNEEEYTAELTKMIAHALEGNSNSLFAADVRKNLLERCANAAIPVEFLKKWLISRNEGLNAENIDEEFEKMREGLLWQIIKGQLMEQLGVKVTEEAVLANAKSIAYNQFAQYGMSNLGDDVITEHAKRILANEEYREQIVENVAENLLYDAIRNASTIDNQSVSLDRFKEIAQAQ